MQVVAYIPNHSDFFWSIPGFYGWHPQNVHCLKTNKNPKNSVAWMVPVFLHIPSLFRIFSCCPTQELKELEISFEVTSKDGKPRAKGLEIVGRDRGTGAEWSGNWLILRIGNNEKCWFNGDLRHFHWVEIAKMSWGHKRAGRPLNSLTNDFFCLDVA